MIKPAKRSPIRDQDKPLRLPGQSLHEQLTDLMAEFMEGVAMIIVMAAVTLLLGLNWLFKPPHYAIFLIAVSYLIGSAIYYGPKSLRAFKKMKRVKLGRDGERVVGDILDELKVGGGYVLHDLVGGNFNIDHVLFTRQGIFVIETKTWSKDTAKSEQIVYDGHTLKKGEDIPRKDALEQARANAKWVADLLESTTGVRYPVKPVVLFPGWYITATPGARGAEVWVLNPKALGDFVKNKPKVLEAEAVKLGVRHLKTFSRQPQNMSQHS